MNSNEDVRGQFPETLVLGTGITAIIAPIAYQTGILLKYGSGGTLSIIGPTYSFQGSFQGSTFATAKSYLLGTTEILSLSSKGAITLIATGATTTVYMLRATNIPIEGL